MTLNLWLPSFDEYMNAYRYRNSFSLSSSCKCRLSGGSTSVCLYTGACLTDLIARTALKFEIGNRNTENYDEAASGTMPNWQLDWHIEVFFLNFT
jgi:hypothetical protein